MTSVTKLTRTYNEFSDGGHWDIPTPKRTPVEEHIKNLKDQLDMTVYLKPRIYKIREYMKWKKQVEKERYAIENHRKVYPEYYL